MLRASAIHVLAFALSASASAADAPSTALLPLAAPDLLEPQRRAIEERIRELAEQQGSKLQPAADTAKGVAQAKEVGVACNLESLACQAQIGVVIGVQQVLVARIASDWSGDRIELRLLDALRGASLREAKQQLPKDAARRTRVIEGVVLRVVAPDITSSIEVTGNSAGSEVLVDGVLTARPGPQVVEGLAPGPHDIELRVDGNVVDARTVDLATGIRVPVSFGDGTGANTTTTPAAVAGGGAGVWPWLVGSGAALAAVGGIGAGALQATLEFSRLERDQRSALRATGIGMLGAMGVGVIVAGTGGVLFALEGPSP